MARPRHEMAAGDDRGRPRAAHADRERVVGTLKAAYVYGLVTKDEFDARVDQTFAARTYAELAAITADIPAGLAPAPPPLKPAPTPASPPEPANLSPGQRAVVATAILAVLLFFAALCAGDSIIPPLLVGAVGSGLVSLCLAGAQMASARRGNRTGVEPPPQRMVRHGPGPGRRVASAAPAEQLPGTKKPRRPGNAEAARRHSLRPQVSS